MMSFRRFFLVFFVVSIIFSSSCFAIGIITQHPSYEGVYDDEPIVIEYYYKGSITKKTEATVEGNIAPYVTLSQEEFSSSEGDFTGTIEFDDEAESTKYSGSVCIGEVSDEKVGGISSLTRSCGRLSVLLMTDEADLYGILQTQRTDDREIITYTVINYGRESVNYVDANIVVRNAEGEEVFSLSDRSSEVLASQEQVIFYFVMEEVGDYKPGYYYMTAEASSSGIETEVTEGEFRLGEEFVGISDYQKELFINSGIQAYNINLENFWSEELNAYAEINIGGQIIKSATSDFDAWEQKGVTLYVNTDTLELKTYDVEATIYFGEEQSTSQILSIGVVEKEVEVVSERADLSENNDSNVMLFVVGSALVFILVIVSIFVFRKWDQDKGSKKEEYIEGEEF